VPFTTRDLAIRMPGISAPRIDSDQRPPAGETARHGRSRTAAAF
jgi:hypothetical protein